MKQHFDAGAVMAEIELAKESLAVLNNMWVDGELFTESELMAGSMITTDVLPRVIQHLVTALSDLEPLKKGGRA